MRWVRDPAQWSADHYRRSNELFFAAVRREAWREPGAEAEE